MRTAPTPRWAASASSASLESSSAEESPESVRPRVSLSKKSLSRGSCAALGLSLVASSVALSVICFLLGRLQLTAARESRTISSMTHAVHATVDVALAAGEEHAVYVTVACENGSVANGTSSAAARTRTNGALSRYRELSNEQRAHLDPELESVFHRQLAELGGARSSCADMESSFHPAAVFACHAPFRNASAAAIHLAASALQHHEVGTATLLRLLSWSDFTVHMSEASVWRGIVDHVPDEEYVHKFYVYVGATVALGRAAITLDAGPVDQGHARVNQALDMLDRYASAFPLRSTSTDAASSPHSEWRPVLAAARDAASGRITELRRASVEAAEARAAEARSLVYVGVFPLVAVSVLLIVLLRIAYRAERRRCVGRAPSEPSRFATLRASFPHSTDAQHISDIAQRAAIQYALHHTRNPLHQLAALVTMLRDALPPPVRGFPRVKWAFHELHSALHTMTAVVDYTLLMDTPFKPVHSMVPVEVHIPSFSRDLVFQHAELLPGLDMRYFVHKDVPPYVLTDGNWLRRALSAVLMEGANLSRNSWGGVVELECRVLSAAESEAVEPTHTGPASSYLARLQAIQESGSVHMDSGVGESARIVREGLGGQMGVGCDDQQCDCPAFPRSPRKAQSECGAEDGRMCGPSSRQQTRWARLRALRPCGGKDTRLSVWAVVPVATGGSSMAAPAGAGELSLDIRQDLEPTHTATQSAPRGGGEATGSTSEAHSYRSDAEGEDGEEEPAGACASSSQPSRRSEVQPSSTSSTKGAQRSPELPPLPAVITAPPPQAVGPAQGEGPGNAAGRVLLPPLPPTPVRPQSNRTDAPAPAPAGTSTPAAQPSVVGSSQPGTESGRSRSLPGPPTVGASHGASAASRVLFSENTEQLSPSTAQSAPVSSASATSPPQRGSPPAGSGPYRILVVDDERLNRRFACHVLQKLGHSVESAADGDEVVPRVEAAEREGRGFHYVMLDLIMLRVHGDAACRQLRARGYQGAIFCITANTDEANLNRCHAAGFDAIFAKPCRPTDLRAALRKHPPPSSLWARGRGS